MLQNPFLPSPSQYAAWNEGFAKGLTARVSPQPSENVGSDDMDAFNQGVQQGVNCQSAGIDLGVVCVPAAEPGMGEGAHVAISGTELTGELAMAIAERSLAAALEGVIVTFALLLITSSISTLPPERVLPSVAQPMIDSLATMGLDSIQLYMGIGIDATVEDCEFKLSPLFLTRSQAQAAATAFNRYSSIVVSWRTDQSGSFTVV